MTPDEKVLALIERKARAGAYKAHLRQCPDLKIEQSDIHDGVYGCDTGCEYASLEVLLTCPHGEREWYEYGTFGDMADLIAELDAPPSVKVEPVPSWAGMLIEPVKWSLLDAEGNRVADLEMGDDGRLHTGPLDGPGVVAFIGANGKPAARMDSVFLTNGQSLSMEFPPIRITED